VKAAAMMIPGIWVDFGGGRRLLVPPLSLGALELLHERLTELSQQTMTDPRSASTIIEAAHIALKRNYPDMTREEVGDLVDLGNVGEVYECIMDVTGIRRKSVATAGSDEGNASAMGAQAGAASSPSSAPTPAGPGPTSESTSTFPPLTP
jgi:hypothetical protein